MKTKNAIKARNLVRGALSTLRALSTPDAMRDDWRQEQFAQQQINRALAIARRQLDRRELYEFERWVTASAADQNRAAKGLGTPLTSLGILPSEINSRDLATELGLGLEKLEKCTPALHIFFSDAAMLAKAVAERNWEGAIEILQKIVKQHNYSYWAIETELALKQSSLGVEAVKSHIRSMSIGALGLNNFFLYYFGVRNEPAQTSSRFKSNLRKKIDESDLSIDLQVYAKYRLYGELGAGTSPLAKILACEQQTTVIDLCFTTLKICKVVLNRKSAFTPEVIAMANHASSVLDPLLTIFGIGDRTEAGAVLRSRVNAPIHEIASRAVCLVFAPAAAGGIENHADEHIVRGIASQLSTRNDGVAAEFLAKELLNLSCLPIAMELGDVSLVPPIPKLFQSRHRAGVDSDSLLTILESVLRMEQRELLDITTIEMLEPIVASQSPSGLGAHLDAALILKSALKKTTNAAALDILSVMLAHELYRADELQECLEISAQTGISNDRLVQLLPLVEIFQGIKWPTLRSLGASVDLSITLDHFLRVIEDRKIRTFKRYSIEELMKVNGCTSIVELPSALLAAGVDIDRIEYFFSQVCDVFSLELLPGMGESKKVRAIRSELLRKLAGMHTKQEVAYLQDAEDIDDALQVDDGLNVLDDSKVYVDEQAVLNFINQELAADFQRYLNLVESGLGISDSINEVLKSFNSLSAKTFQIPKNDADDLLAELIAAILHRFLFDPASGLDIIVGRRIRHGTIAGEIRGVLEKAELIGHKPKAGASYEPPLKVERLGSKMEPKSARIVYAATSRFSESIDQLIALLRDEYFHVNSTSKPRGIFNLNVNSVVLALARSVAQTCDTIEQFSKECIELFWFFLSVPLEAARPTVESEIKRTLQTIFSKVTNELRAQNVGDPTFFAEFQQVSEELQRRASIIASWIRVPKINSEGKTYSLNRIVDVAVAVVTGQKPGFKPIINRDVSVDLELDTHGFYIVADALYIALVNVAQHSGKKIDNQVNIKIQFNSDTSHLVFEVVSEVLVNTRTTDQEARLAGIRLDIQKRAFSERARLDRHSGLFKLAALVSQSDKTSISFGYLDSTHFRLKFELVYIGLSGESKSASALNGDAKLSLITASIPRTITSKS
jgi:hypothetical protein